jgi:hypothetical protein
MSTHILIRLIIILCAAHIASCTLSLRENKPYSSYIGKNLRTQRLVWMREIHHPDNPLANLHEIVPTAHALAGTINLPVWTSVRFDNAFCTYGIGGKQHWIEGDLCYRGKTFQVGLQLDNPHFTNHADLLSEYFTSDPAQRTKP